VFRFAVLAYLALVPAFGAIGAAWAVKYKGMPIRQVFHFGRDDVDFMKRTIGRILRRG